MLSIDPKELLTWCDDLHQVKGNVSQLQATLNQILAKAPTLEQFKNLSLYLELNGSNKDPRSIGGRTKSLLISPQLKVAVRLKHLCEAGLLPELLALCRINFKSNKADKFVGYFLDYIPPKNVAETLPDVLTKNIIKSKYADIATYPPTLPPISDESLLRRVLTDKSFRQPSDFIELETLNDFNQAHNAKLSLKGRSLLEYLIIDILESKFTSIHEDDVFLFSHKLLSKSILARLALGYNLVDQYNFNFSKELSLEEKLKCLSNIFLAYVAGLTLDGYSLEEIGRWIEKLYEPLWSDLSDSIDKRPISKFSLAELNFLFKRLTDIYAVQPEEVSIEFTELDTDPYVVRLNVNGEGLGVGTSSKSLEDAKERAAEESFRDKSSLDHILTTLIDRYKADDSVSSNSNDEEDSYSPRLDSDGYESPVPESFADYKPEKRVNESRGTFSRSDIGNGSRQSKSPAFHNLPPSLPSIPNRPQPYGAPPQLQDRPLAPYVLTPLIDVGPTENGIDNSAKNNLYALLGPLHLTPTYKFLRSGNDFLATVLVNDVVLGEGYDNNKKIASQKAATNALNNTSALLMLGVGI
ncbi:uncharacterized protein PRCAT00005289001 [Priceomyces carsonii]|uniref:uncharacterized protein n=1 Tax=Priceomyces carsonii TaxID=28549 RepID=UPI002ED85022|nr:unnamed protein product [Priceomyces carsonii]